MKKFLLNTIVLICFSFLNFSCGNNTGESRSTSDNDLTNFEYDSYITEKKVELDGIDCNFQFYIDWPSNENSEIDKKIISWISKVIINQEKIFKYAYEFEEAVIKSVENNGYIVDHITVKIINIESKIYVECITNWAAGYSIHSPNGKTVSKAVFDINNGEILYENTVGYGEDEIKNIKSEKETVSENIATISISSDTYFIKPDGNVTCSNPDLYGTTKKIGKDHVYKMEIWSHEFDGGTFYLIVDDIIYRIDSGSSTVITDYTYNPSTKKVTLKAFDGEPLTKAQFDELVEWGVINVKDPTSLDQSLSSFDKEGTVQWMK